MVKRNINRVAIVMILLVTIQLAFIAATIIGEQRQRIRNAKQTALKMSTVAVSSTEDFFQKYIAIFETLKSLDSIIQQERTASSILFQRLREKHSEAVNFAAVKKDGYFFASGKPMPLGKGPNIRDLDFFKRMAAGESVVIMEPHTGPISKVFVTGIAVRLETLDGKFNGEVGVSIKFQALMNRWSELFSNSDILITVDDGNGKLYFLSPELKDVAEGRLVEILTDQPRKTQLQGMTFAMNQSESALSGWRFSVFVPAHFDLLDFATLRKELVALCIFMIITLIAFAFWSSRERQWISKLKREQQNLQQSEARFRQLAENINAVFWISSPDKNEFLYVSPKFEEIWGFDRRKLFDNPWCWAEAIHEDDRDRIREASIEKQAVGEYDETYRILRDDGGLRWIHDRAFPLRDEKEKVYRVVGIAEDITDRKQLQAQLQQAMKMESIGTLAGGIAHDFNNILSSIIGFTELALDDTVKGTPMEDDLQEVYTAGKRARDLVKQILAFARQSEEVLRPVKVATIVKEVLKLLRSTIPTTIEIQEDIQSNSLVMGNPSQVHQLIINLCTNAYQAMENAGGILKVELIDVEDSSNAPLPQSKLNLGSYIKLTISDSGPGISPDIIDSIFEPYFTTKSVGEGTGMGLALVHGIVESYGGHISVESESGKGAVFSTYLPTTPKGEDYLPYEKNDLPKGTEHILFVDDEGPIANVGSQILDRLGYSVTTRTCSVEALELFRSNPNAFDLVISDLTMPKMTGDELARALISIRHDIAVILCTGYSKKITDESATEIGIKAFAYKPIVKADMAKTVRKVLDEAKS